MDLLIFIPICVFSLFVFFGQIFLGFLLLDLKFRKNYALKIIVQEEKPDNLPKSGFWITCRNHGSMSINLNEYNRQCEKFQLRCPRCESIPTAIWKEEVIG